MMLDKDVFLKGEEVAQISFDPTNLLLVMSKAGEVVAISLVESKVKYTYLDLGKEQYATSLIVINKKINA